MYTLVGDEIKTKKREISLDFAVEHHQDVLLPDHRSDSDRDTAWQVSV